jgi:hypothetical protein
MSQINILSFVLFQRRFALKMGNLQNQNNGTFMEQSLTIVKQDCMQRKLAGQVLSRLGNASLQPTACKIINLEDNLLNDYKFSPDISAISR